MRFNSKDLRSAVDAGIISNEQLDGILDHLSKKRAEPSGSRLDLTNLLYYTGALVIILAMTWFMTISWESYGGWGIMSVASVYALFFTGCAYRLNKENKTKTPAGLLITAAVCMMPLIVYGFERATGLWPQGDPGVYRNYHIWVKGSWLAMELATLLAGAIAIRYFKFPFLTAPIAFTLWYMSMDLAPLLFGKDVFDLNQRMWVSTIFGAGMLVLAYYVDKRYRTKEKDFGFWLYLFGSAAFCGGISVMQKASAWQELLLFGIYLAFILSAPYLSRIILFVCGSLGAAVILPGLAMQATRVFSITVPFYLVLLLSGAVLAYSALKLELDNLKSGIEERLLYASAIYFYGAMAIFLGICLIRLGNDELQKFVLFCTSIIYMLVSVALRRKIFLVLGALGVLYYLSHLAYEIFENSPLFPIVLAGIGLSLIFAGIKAHNKKDSINAFVMRLLPAKLADLMRSKMRNSG